jgi:protein associated with RNAse G/E
MKPGDLIWVRVFKADGTPYRSWQALVESIADGCVVTLTRASNPVYLRDRVYAQAHHMRNYYWPGRRHDLLEVYEPDGRLHELYVNIASPVELLEQFGYTEQFMQESYALAESLLDVVANWRPLGMETPGF